MKKTILSCLTFLLLLPAGYASADPCVEGCVKRKLHKNVASLPLNQQYSICQTICKTCPIQATEVFTDQSYCLSSINDEIIKETQICTQELLKIDFPNYYDTCIQMLVYNGGADAYANCLINSPVFNNCKNGAVSRHEDDMNACRQQSMARYITCIHPIGKQVDKEVSTIQPLNECANKCEKDYPIDLVDRRDCIQKCGWTNK